MTNRLLINWLKLACIFTGLVGIIAVAASTPVLSKPWLFLFDILNWPVDNNPAAFHEETYTINAVLGGVMIGWAALMYFLVKGPVAKGNIEVAKFILIALIIWFTFDSIGSILAGLPGNVLLNVLFLVLFLPPLIQIVANKRVL